MGDQQFNLNTTRPTINSIITGLQLHETSNRDPIVREREEVTDLAAHLVRRDGHEEEVRLVGVVGAEPTLADVLEEVALAGVLARELPRRLVERLGVAVRVDVHLEAPLHLRVPRRERLGRVVHRRGGLEREDGAGLVGGAEREGDPGGGERGPRSGAEGAEGEEG